jgi:hypothetical protein
MDRPTISTLWLTFNQGLLLCCIVNLLVNFIALGGICISMLAWKEKTYAVTQSLEFLPQSSPTLSEAFAAGFGALVTASLDSFRRATRDETIGFEQSFASNRAT